MVPVNKMMLSTNALPLPVLTQIKYTYGRQRESSKSGIITIIIRSDAAVTLIKLLFVSTYGKSKINTINKMPSFKWSVVKSVSEYSNISKRCLLCLHEKFEIVNYPNQKELSNKRSELISKGRHANKYLLANYKSND